MKVKLSAVGNPDFGQPKNIGIPTKWVTVKSLKEASDVCRAFIREHSLGMGNWNGGLVKVGSKDFAKISYNGRAWAPGPYPQPELPLS